MRNQNPQHVVTDRVRLSYVHLFTPYARPGNIEAKFSVTVLLPKSDVVTKQRIDAAINAAIEAGVGKIWNGVRPPILGIPIYDGDGTRPSDGMPFGPECKGHWVFTASSKQAPQIVDGQLNPIIDQTQVYSGIYARISCQFFPYSSNGKKGVGCGLGNVQKIADGEPLGNRTSPEEDFGGYSQQTNYGQQAHHHGYGQRPPQQYPPAPPPQIDPITGKPLNGGIMGLPQ